VNFLRRTFPKNDLITNITKRLKTFEELKTEYKMEESIYRTAESEYFSEKSEKYCIYGVPTSRPSTRLLNYHSTKPTEDLDEPIWFSTTINDSIQYCNKKSNLTYPCVTYEYKPYLITEKVHNKPQKKIVFLDLNGTQIKDPNDLTKIRYQLDESFMKMIYNKILQDYQDHFIEDEDNPVNGKFMAIDNACDNVYTIIEILSAYGYYEGYRNSEHYIDKFFTYELFSIIDDLKIESNMNCIFMGYFHSNVLTAELNKNEFEPSGYLPAEFAIPYKRAINKHCMEHLGLAVENLTIVTKSKKNKKRKYPYTNGGKSKGGKKRRKTQRNRK
jgi:hypothetical protein